MEPAGPKQRISRACDACRLRKVKCNGQQRCQQCSHLNLRCVYSTTASRQRSQAKRGSVITGYKKSTSATTTMTAATGLASLPAIAPAMDSPSSAGSDHSNGLPVFNVEFFLSLLPDYLEAVYPPQPIMTVDEIKESIARMDIDSEAKAFVFAYAGTTLNLQYYGSRRTAEVARMIDAAIRISIEARGGAKPKMEATVRKAITCLYLHNCFMTQRDADTAFFYVREAITTIQLLRIDSSLSPVERARRQRLYWEAWIHERFLSIVDYRQAILPNLPTLPEEDHSIPYHIYEGFNQIIKLFLVLDFDFLDNWLAVDRRSTAVTAAWVERKNKQLEGELDISADDMARLKPMQQADLLVTRQWLRTLVWRLAMSKTLLSSSASKEYLSLLFPVRLSQELRKIITSVSNDDIEVHGSGITQKLFEITDTVADVIIHVPAPTREDTALRVHDFLFLLRFFFSWPALDKMRRQMLSSKLETLQSLFPDAFGDEDIPRRPSAHSQASPADTTMQQTLRPLLPQGYSPWSIESPFDATSPAAGEQSGQSASGDDLTHPRWNEMSGMTNDGFA